MALAVVFRTALGTTGMSLATLWKGGMLGPSNVSRMPAGNSRKGRRAGVSSEAGEPEGRCCERCKGSLHLIPALSILLLGQLFAFVLKYPCGLTAGAAAGDAIRNLYHCNANTSRGWQEAHVLLQVLSSSCQLPSPA